VKTIHYLSGLPRSGNTVLSALLNQNPQIFSSPISPLSQIMYKTEMECVSSENFVRNPDYIGLNNLLKNMPHNYYGHIKEKIIFDREKSWTTPNNLNRLINFVNPNPKIIFTVRSTLDILKSFILQSNNHSFLEENMKSNDYFPSYYLTKNDAICEYIMTSTHLMGKSLLALHNALKPENKKYVHFVDYNNLINTPKDTMTNLYEFLEIDYFNHDFYNIKSLETNNDTAANLPQTLHEVHPVLKHYSPPIEEVLSPYIINKYKDVDLWKQIL